jgi:tetratricopeptide (TPR) repeat protein
LAATTACAALKTFIVETLNVFLLPDNPRSRRPMNTLELNLLHQIETAFEGERWGEVCRLGSAISRSLWVSGHYELRTQIGARIEAAAAYSKAHALRARTLIDDLGWTRFTLGQDREAEKHILDGVRLAKECDDSYAIAKGLRHLGSISRRRSDQEAARLYLEEASAAAARIEDDTERHEIESSLLVSRGKLYVAAGSAAEGVRAFEAALRAFEERGDREREVKLYSLIGEGKLALGATEEAIWLFERGRQRARELGRFDELAANVQMLIDALPPEQRDRRVNLWKDVYDYAIANGLWEQARSWRGSAPASGKEMR